MELIENFTKTLQPCGSCGKSDLSDPFYDQFWKPKEENGIRIDADETNSGGSGQSGGSTEESA